MTMMTIKTTAIIPLIAPPAIAPALLPSLSSEYVRLCMYVIPCSHQYIAINTLHDEQNTSSVKAQGQSKQ